MGARIDREWTTRHDASAPTTYCMTTIVSPMYVSSDPWAVTESGSGSG